MAANITQNQSFVFAKYDLDAIGANAYGSITVAVHGFWSHDPITLRINRETTFNRETGERGHEWLVTMSHSTGGRDRDNQPDDLIAETCFSHALSAMASLGLYVRSPEGIARLETAAQAEMARYEAEQDEKRAAKQARIDKDEARGEHRAKLMMEELRRNLENAGTGHGVIAHSYPRGEDKPEIIEARKYSSGVAWFCDGFRISRFEMLKKLAASSVRAL